MTSLEELLGIDMSDPLTMLAHDLTESDASLRESLRAARVAAGMTQEDVAAAIGCDLWTVGEVENVGGDPRMSLVRRYALSVRVAVTHTVTPRPDGD